MDFSSSPTNWYHSFFYITFISALLYFLHTQIAPKLLIGHQPVSIKKTSPNLPLRFRSDGTFKILQVLFLQLAHCQVVILSSFDWWVLILFVKCCYCRWLICIMGMEGQVGAEMCWTPSLQAVLIITRRCSSGG